MKQTITFIFSFLVSIQFVLAQAPQAITYQAVARDTAGNLIANQSISLRFSIHDATANGTVVYSERHVTTTDELGLFNVNVGQGTFLSGNFSTIAWSSGSKFLQMEIDPAGGTSYSNMGAQQMLSVPYALSSGNTWSLTGNAATSSHFLGTTNPTDLIVKTNNTERLRISSSGNVGIGGITNPSAPLHIYAGSSGAVSPVGSVAVFENDANTYLSLLSPVGSFSGLKFGSPSGTQGIISFENANNYLSFSNGGKSVSISNAGVTLGAGVEVRRSPSQLADFLPAAFGTILNDGSIYKSSGNFTCTWNSQDLLYEIILNGVEDHFRYVVIVTLSNVSGYQFNPIFNLIPVSSGFSGEITVAIGQVNTGNRVQSVFSFVAFKH